jgi:hypothetical protein
MPSTSTVIIAPDARPLAKNAHSANKTDTIVLINRIIFPLSCIKIYYHYSTKLSTKMTKAEPFTKQDAQNLAPVPQIPRFSPIGHHNQPKLPTQ